MEDHKIILDPNPKHFSNEDLYALSSFASHIYDCMKSCDAPRTIGIFGGWGAGKTTVKNFLLEKIYKEKNIAHIHPIDFNAWLYDQHAGILGPLICKLMDEAKRREVIK